MVTADLILGWESLYIRLKRRAPGVDVVGRLAIALGVRSAGARMGRASR